MSIIGICLQEIQFQEGEDFSEVQLMRTGKFMHPFFDDFEIDEDMFKSFKKNFDSKVKKIDIAVDFSHRSDLEAAGWIRKVELREKNQELWITVEWTEVARQKILDKEFRYMSADFTTNYVDNETGKKFGPTLNGAGLTNRPFIKDMEAVLSDLDVSDKKRQAIEEILNEKPEEEPEMSKMTPEESKAYIATLSDEEKNDMGLIKEVTLSDDEAKAKLEASEKENKELSEKLATEKKDREFSTMLSEGKACEAQREAFMSDNVAEFAEKAVKLNDKTEGNGGEPEKKKNDDDKGPKTFDEAQDKIVKLCEARMKEDKTLNVGDVHKEVLSENPDLEKIMEAEEGKAA